MSDRVTVKLVSDMVVGMTSEAESCFIPIHPRSPLGIHLGLGPWRYRSRRTPMLGSKRDRRFFRLLEREARS